MGRIMADGGKTGGRLFSNLLSYVGGVSTVLGVIAAVPTTIESYLQFFKRNVADVRVEATAVEGDALIVTAKNSGGSPGTIIAANLSAFGADGRTGWAALKAPFAEKIIPAGEARQVIFRFDRKAGALLKEQADSAGKSARVEHTLQGIITIVVREGNDEPTSSRWKVGVSCATQCRMVGIPRLEWYS